MDYSTSNDQDKLTFKILVGIEIEYVMWQFMSNCDRRLACLSLASDRPMTLKLVFQVREVQKQCPHQIQGVMNIPFVF